MKTIEIPHTLTTRSPLLREMLDWITVVDFRKLVGLDEEFEERKLTKKEIIVCVIDELLRVVNENNLGLCKLNGSIYAFNGQYWSLINNDDFKSFLGDAACLMGLKRTDAKYFSFQEQLYSQFVVSANLTAQERDRTVTIINLQNGTFEINSETGRLREFNRNDALTYQLPFNYDETATAPIFQEYLDRVLPDNDLQDILAEFIGYIFVKGLKLEKCLLLYGSGANGKSVFFEIVNALLGKENISNFSLGHLAEEHNRALLSNKLLNYGSEIRANIDSDVFKQLVSGEPVQCRMKYGNSFMVDDYAKLCFNCNELPKEIEHTEAFFRRFLIIPFSVTIPEEERDPDLANEIIYSELSGVFNWVLNGLKRLLFHRTFTHSEVVNETVTIYKQQSDSVFLFLQDGNFSPSDSNYVQAKCIYALYRKYCMSDGYMPLNKSNFNKRLKNYGYVVDRKNSGLVVYLNTQKKEQE